MNVKTVLLLGMSLLLTACKSTPNFDFDNSVNFSNIKTYAWIVESKPQSDGQEYFKSDINNKRIVVAIERDLQAKGLRKVAPNEANVLVNYFTAVNVKKERNATITHPYYYRFGPRYLGNYLNLNNTQSSYKEGALVIDFINTKKELIWRGSNETRLTKKSTPEKRLEQVNMVVSEILLNFPPKTI